MTLGEVTRLFDYWRENPSRQTLLSIIAQCLGWKPPKRRDLGIIEGVSYKEAAKETESWFANPARFFRKKDEIKPAPPPQKRKHR